MARNKKPLELTELQLAVLLGAYITNRANSDVWLVIQTRGWAISSVSLEKKGLIERYRYGREIHVRATKRGSRLLATNYPLETVKLLAVCVEMRGSHNGPHRRCIRRMLLQVPPEQYPELITSSIPVLRELATKQWEVLQNEIR